MVDHPRRAEHHPALAAQRLGERGRDDHVVGSGETGRLGRAPAAVAQHPEPMGVVHDQARPVLPARLRQRGQRCRVAVDGEDRIGDDDRRSPVRGERLAHRLRIGVPDHLPGPPGQSAAVDEGGVVARVGDDQGVVRAQRGDRGQVRRVAGREDQCGLEAAEVRQLPLQLGVQLGGAGDEPGAGGTAAPPTGGRGGPLDDLGVVGQTQVVVARQVHQRRVGGARAQGPYESGAAARLGLLVDPAERHGSSGAFVGSAQTLAARSAAQGVAIPTR